MNESPTCSLLRNSAIAKVLHKKSLENVRNYLSQLFYEDISNSQINYKYGSEIGE